MRKALEMLSFLNDDDLEWFLQNGQIAFHPADAILIQEDSPIDALQILLQGSLTVCNKSGDVVLATLYPGELIGEISFVTSRQPVARVVAREASRTIVVKGHALEQKFSNDTGFASRFFRALAALLAERLRLTTAHFGFGLWNEELGALDAQSLDAVSSSSLRFDYFLKRTLEIAAARH